MLTPSPGIIIITPLDTKSEAITIGKPKFQKIKKGKVLAVGPTLITDFGTAVETSDYVKIGDLVWFLSYEEGYDSITEDNKEYFVIKCQDVRAVIK